MTTKDHTTYQTMNTNFIWSTDAKDEKSILYSNYLYRLKRENKNGLLIYVCTFKWCTRTITLKNNVIINLNSENQNHDLKLPENVQTVYSGLKSRILADIDQHVTKIYGDEAKGIC